MSNYPDGMSESEIPGWFDIDCPSCEGEGIDVIGDICWRCEGNGKVDSRDIEDEREDDRDDDERIPSSWYKNDWA